MKTLKITGTGDHDTTHVLDAATGEDIGAALGVRRIELRVGDPDTWPNPKLVLELACPVVLELKKSVPGLASGGRPEIPGLPAATPTMTMGQWGTGYLERQGLRPGETVSPVYSLDETEADGSPKLIRLDLTLATGEVVELLPGQRVRDVDRSRRPSGPAEPSAPEGSGTSSGHHRSAEPCSPAPSDQG